MDFVMLFIFVLLIGAIALLIQLFGALEGGY